MNEKKSKYLKYGGKVKSEFYTSDELKAWFQNAAKKEGLPYTKFMYLAVEERARKTQIFREKDFRALADIHGQVRQASVNLNQMLRQLYLYSDGATTRLPDVDSMRVNAQDISDAIKHLRSFMDEFSAKNNPGK